jgi:hypothetical protein
MTTIDEAKHALDCYTGPSFIGPERFERIAKFAADFADQIAAKRVAEERERVESRLKAAVEALEFIADHLESELGLLSADDYDTEFGTNENVILAFNKAMEASGCGRRIRLWME